MALSYRYLIAPNVVDGLHLGGIEKAKQEEAPGYALIASDDPSCALAFGFHIPADYTGISGLLAHKPDDLAVEIAGAGSALEVIFPNRPEIQSAPYAILLDQLRFRMSTQKAVTVVLDYRSLVRNLPPMYPSDEVVLFWEARELITQTDLDAFQYLGERIEHEQPSWSSIRLYTREKPVGPHVEVLASQIRTFCGYCSSDPVISI